MAYEVHITRQSDAGAEVEISLEEWNRYIDSDPELERPAPGSPNEGKNLAYLTAREPDDESWLSWGSGGLHSAYPQAAMLKKIGQVARHFGAVVRSDDGDIWTIDEQGRVSMEGM